MLILVSLSALLLPSAWTGRLGNLVQVLAPLQDLLHRTSIAGGEVLKTDEPPSDAELRALIESLESRLVSLAARNRRLLLDNEALTRVRGRGLGMRGRLIPARIIADDSTYWRRSKLLLGGTRMGIARGDSVVSQRYEIDAAASDQIDPGMALLASEVLIGVIERVGTHTSQVKLLSDPETRMPVVIGRMEEGAVAITESVFWLVGRGKGRIEVRDVHHRYVDGDDVRLGDVILTPDDSPNLPPSVSIGTISAIDPDPDNALLYVLRIDQPVQPDSLRRVYVADIEG